MWTFIVVAAIGVAWYGAQKMYEREPSWRTRRLRSSLVWAAIGAIVGSFFGVAGFGTAIAGTIPGAILGYLVVGHRFKVDRDTPPDSQIVAANTGIPDVAESSTHDGLDPEYFKRVEDLRAKFQNGELSFVQGTVGSFATIDEAKRHAERGALSAWATDQSVREFERLQTWWVESDEEAQLGRVVPTFMYLVNTSEQAIGGILLKVSDKGWVPDGVSSTCFHAVRFAVEIAPHARVIVGFARPSGLQSGGPCSADIVGAWYG